MITVGFRIAGRYEIQEALGQGAAATVLRAVDRELDRPVALKLLTGKGAVAEPERLADEARALAQLHHPNILQVFEAGVHEGMAFLVTELVTGGTAMDLLQGPEVPEERLVELCARILEALEAAHGAGVLHRDIKPENILLTDEGAPKLADFGLAKAQGSQVRTRTGLLVGTPEFMAPELFQGRRALPATDLYAWGVLAYLLRNRHVPFLGDLSETVKLKLAGTWEPGEETGGLAAAIARALEPDPDRRGDAASLLAILRGADPSKSATRVVGAAAVLSTGGGPTPPRGRLPVALAGTGLLGVLLVVGFLLSGGSPAPSPGGVARSTSGPDPSEEVRGWIQRLREVDAAAVISGLNEDVYPRTQVLDMLGSNFFPAVMVAVRKGERGDAQLEVLDEARLVLPYRERFLEEAAMLTRAIADHRVPFADRAALFTAAQELAHLDRYWEAWGRIPPYRARPLLDAFASVRSEAPERDWKPAPPLPEEGLAGTGRAHLFRWGDPDPDYPVLFPDYGNPNGYEKMAWKAWVSESSGRFDPGRHEGIDLVFRLADLDGGPGRRREVVAQTGGLFLANWLQLEVNGQTLPYHAEPDRASHIYWLNDPLPDYVIHWELPRELLVVGENKLRLRVRSLPGLRRCCGMGINELELRVFDP